MTGVRIWGRCMRRAGVQTGRNRGPTSRQTVSGTRPVQLPRRACSRLQSIESTRDEHEYAGPAGRLKGKEQRADLFAAAPPQRRHHRPPLRRPTPTRPSKSRSSTQVHVDRSLPPVLLLSSPAQTRWPRRRRPRPHRRAGTRRPSTPQPLGAGSSAPAHAPRHPHPRRPTRSRRSMPRRPSRPRPLPDREAAAALFLPQPADPDRQSRRLQQRRSRLARLPSSLRVRPYPPRQRSVARPARTRRLLQGQRRNPRVRSGAAAIPRTAPPSVRVPARST